MTVHQLLITGANRGIGLEFVRQYAQDGWKVLACCRDPQHATDLLSLANAHSGIRILELDVADFAQVEALALQLKEEEIDLLLNNAAIYPASNLGNTDTGDWLEAFQVNCIAPMKMAEAFLPQIARSRLRKMATISSKMGSLDDNTSGGSYIYRSSKAAVNMVMKTLSIDLIPFGISVVTLHPGWVLTRMGGANALIDTHKSVSGMRRVIGGLHPSNSGQFIAYDGSLIDW